MSESEAVIIYNLLKPMPKSLPQLYQSIMMDVKEEEKENADWLELPESLITFHILSKLISIYDYARFGVVCVQWRSILLKDYYYCPTRSLQLPPQLPLLIIPTPPASLTQSQEKKNDNTNSYSFYRITDGKIYNGLQLAMSRDTYVRGSGHGWLITVDIDKDGICRSVQLMNPFFSYPANYTTTTTTKEIKLPLLTSTEFIVRSCGNYVNIRKVVLSADPVSYPKDFIVMAIFSRGATSKGLAFCKPGDVAWTLIDNRNFKWNEIQLFDLIYNEGKFYALSLEGIIVVCNVAERTSTIFAGPPVPECYCHKNYLVVSAGEFFQVRMYANGKNSIKRCEVFKLKVSGIATEWMEVKDLGDRAFFVGHNPSMSISPNDFPGCKPNCIYYTDGRLFKLENGNLEQYCSPTVAKLTLGLPLIWIEPKLLL